jgi:cation diffusion facilitator family transporter
MANSHKLTRYAWLSVAAAVLTISLKGAAYALTGSVGLLSDALESTLNLVTALMALGILQLVSRPPDSRHRFGHTKAEYFSSGAEGAVIVAAAVGIITTAIPRLLRPEPLENLSLGLALSLAASIINLIVARILIRVGATRRSIVLEADGRHLMTDVWTSAGVLVGIAVVWATRWDILDPLVALGVAANIAFSGAGLVRRSFLGLMDSSLPEEDLRLLDDALQSFRGRGLHYHALRTRESGSRRFVSFHVQVPGEWTVQEGHDLLEAVEADIVRRLPGTTVDTHLEPLEDPRSWDDDHLDRHAIPEDDGEAL